MLTRTEETHAERTQREKLHASSLEAGVEALEA